MHVISPLLVQILNKCDVQDIPDDPSIECLPGKFVSLVAEHQQQVPKEYPENFHTLKCGNCGKNAAYDQKYGWSFVFYPFISKEAGVAARSSNTPDSSTGNMGFWCVRDV